MSDYYHNIEDELSMGMVRSDRVLKHVQHQRSRIEELEELRKKTFSALLTATRLHDEAEAKLAKAVDALEFYATQDITYPNVGTVTFHGHDDNGLKARTTLAEIKGGKDGN